MRRILVAAALGVALCVVSACGDTEQDQPQTSSSTTAPAIREIPAAKLETCDAYRSVETQTTAAFQPAMEKVMQGLADPAVASGAASELAKLLSEHEGRLAPVADQATDPQLKAAIEKQMAALAKLRTDLAAAMKDQTLLREVADEVAEELIDSADTIYNLCYE